MILSSLSLALTRAGSNSFNPLSLFTPGRIGAYYGYSWDEILAVNAAAVAAGQPSNAVAFSDLAGTVPIVSPLGTGKTVGYLKDRSGQGFHRIPTSLAAGGSLSRRYNDFISTEDFNSLPNWATLNGTIASNVGVAPDGTGTANELIAVSNTLLSNSATQVITVVPGQSYRFSFAAKPGTLATANYSVYDLTGLAYVIPATSYTSQLVSGNWVRIVVDYTVPVGCVAVRLAMMDNPGTSGTIQLWGADHRSAIDVGSNIPAYQRVFIASSYNETGFPARRRVQTDDWDKITIDPLGATKAVTVTAFQKLGSALGSLVSSSIAPLSNPGTLLIRYNTTGVNYQLIVRGTATNLNSGLLAHPTPGNDVSLIYADAASTPQVRFYLDGLQRSTASADLVSFPAYDLYFNSIAGTVNFADGWEYAPAMVLFMPSADPGLTLSQLKQLSDKFNTSIKAY